MTTTTLTLMDFLLARIAEDEAVARRARDENPDLSWEACQIYDGVYSVDLGPSTHPDSDSGYAVDMGVDLRMPREMALHIENLRPARILADLKAKRRVVDHLRSSAPWTGGGPTALAHFDGFRSGMEFVLRKMAAVYADHPDFNPDWA